MPRCDLQVRSCHSDRPAEWVLRQVGVPESHTKPRALYDLLRGRGCDFVTITDPHTIAGGLEIADLPGVFLSEMVTTYFPEDGCKIHLVVWNLNPRQHEAIQEVRNNIYRLVRYLNEQHLVHGVAHPLHSINERLTVDHFEKLILLFRIFEGLNGNRARLAQDVAVLCLQSLDEAKIGELARRHGLEPTHVEPWRKSFFASSDDNAGLYLGRTWTEVPAAGSPEAFLAALEAGHAVMGGESGDALKYSNSIYRVVFDYAADRLGSTAPKGVELLRKIVQRFLEGQNPTELSFSERIAHLTEVVRSGKVFDLLHPNEGNINRQLAGYFLDGKINKELDSIVKSEPVPERRTFKMASKIANDLFYRLFKQGLDQINKGDFLGSLQPLSGMLPVTAGVLPYLYAYKSLHGNRPLLEKTARTFLPQLPAQLRNTKRAWFTDTLDDVNGVARTIRTMSGCGQKQGREVTVAVCRLDPAPEEIPLQNFVPLGEFEIPEYKLQKVGFPPVLDVVDWVEREKITECIISTPGPLGLSALLAARLLGLRTVGIYHTDFPQYVRILTDDHAMETLMWRFMHWFYVQFDLVYVNSEFYRQCWIERGIPPEKLEILPRGLDSEIFNHRHRQADFWKKRGAEGMVLLYVGRVSKEKELPFLADVCRALQKEGKRFTLAIVGDGPYREEMQKRLPGAIFTGVLSGLELGQAYASADLFVFPSTTDTFGNVVVEAQAAGLPCLVSNVGGPRELVETPEKGRVLPANNDQVWCGAIREELDHPRSLEARDRMASEIQAARSWDRAFAQFWDRGLT
jgi:glycosyltransferase involved in cell wall biosynthesis